MRERRHLLSIKSSPPCRGPRAAPNIWKLKMGNTDRLVKILHDLRVKGLRLQYSRQPTEEMPARRHRPRRIRDRQLSFSPSPAVQQCLSSDGFALRKLAPAIGVSLNLFFPSHRTTFSSSLSSRRHREVPGVCAPGSLLVLALAFA